MSINQNLVDYPSSEINECRGYMQSGSIKEMIEKGIPDCRVIIEGDGTHFQVIVISDQFKGKSMIQQHKMVYETLGNRVGTEIHALSIKSYNGEEWDMQKGLHGL